MPVEPIPPPGSVRPDVAALPSTAIAWRLLLVAVVAQATISFVELGVPVMAPFIKDGLHLSAAGVGLAVAAVNLGRILGSMPSGRIADEIGERLVILLGGVGVAAFAALAALGTYGLLVVALVICGVFAGSSSPAGAKLIMGAFTREQRGLPMGVRQASIPLGALLAAAALPAISEAAGWRWALAAAAVVPLAGAAAAALMSRGSWAFLGPGGNNGGARASLRAIVRDRSIVLAGAWALIFAGGQYAILTYLVLDLLDLGLALSAAVALLALATAGGIVGRLAWGWLSDVAFAGRRRPGLVVLTVSGAATALALGALAGHAPLAVLAALAALGGLSLIGWQGLWVALVSELAPQGGSATAVGFGLTFTNVGIVSWPPTFGLLADLTGDFRVSWLVLGGALSVSLLLLLSIRERPTGADETH